MGLHTTYICLLVIAAADVTQCKHRSVDSANGTKSTEGLKLLQSAHHKSKVPCHKTNISIRKRKLLKVVDEVERALGKSGESLMSMSLHAPHSGKSPDLLVPYEVRKGVHGMGVFTTRPVEKGQKLWVFNAKHHVKIYKEDVPLLHDLLRSKDPNIAVWLTRWTYASEYCENCVLFEMDDGRYMNDAKGPNNNEVSDKGGLVAKEYIPTLKSWKTTIKMELPKYLAGGKPVDASLYVGGGSNNAGAMVSHPWTPPTGSMHGKCVCGSKRN